MKQETQINSTDPHLKTFVADFKSGMESGRHLCPENHAKALRAVADRFTGARVRAYWSGYLVMVAHEHDFPCWPSALNRAGWAGIA